MRVTPMLSAAEAVIVTTPDTVCPAVGEEMATVGGVLSFDTVTVEPVTVTPLAGAVRDTVGGTVSDVPGAPEITLAVAASRASMLAPMSVPSVAAFLYGLDAA